MRLATAVEKRGFVADGGHGVIATNSAAANWWTLGLNDGLKRANRRTYGEWLHAILELEGPVQRPCLEVPHDAKQRAAGVLGHLTPWANRRICINTSASDRFLEKRWKSRHVRALAHQICVTEPATAVLLIGAGFDFDNEGLLDLFQCSFVEFAKDANVDCGTNKTGKRYYCIPRMFKPTAGKLYRNNGDGTFRLASGGTNIQEALGKALGAVATDVNNDGLLDLFVANDTVQNFLFINRSAGKWEEIGLPAEVAFSADGQRRSGMGVDAADYNQDGFQDLFVANIDQEMFSLYHNNGDETFRDDAHLHGISTATRLLSGWGLKFFDYDNDGKLDLFLANGHPDDMIGQYSLQVKYAEPMLLFHQEDGILKNVSATAGPVFQKGFPARGLAVGDFNNDGALDVLISNNGQAPLLLENEAAGGNHWLGLKLEGREANRDAIGARVTWSRGGRTFYCFKSGGGSYLSSHDPRVVRGLGQATKIDWVEIQWPQPSSRTERLTDLPIDRYVRVVEGQGIQG